MLAIPPKRFDKPTVSFLTAVEIDALLDAPDRDRWEGRRDRALLLVAVQTGLRVAELTGLTVATSPSAPVPTSAARAKVADIEPSPSPQRPKRSAPSGWTNEPGSATSRCSRRGPDDASAPTPSNGSSANTPHRSHRCPIAARRQVHPHVLRHSCAMTLLQAGVDTAVIALWLGHADIRSTNTYLHADMTIKQRALDRTTPASIPPGRYRPPDSLLAFLEQL